MLKKSRKLNVKFQFAIPAAASAHEFESKARIVSGYKQLDYVIAAINEIDNQNTRLTPNYLGVNVWAWNDRMIWKGNEYLPATPTDEIKAYLATHL